MTVIAFSGSVAAVLLQALVLGIGAACFGFAQITNEQLERMLVIAFTKACACAGLHRKEVVARMGISESQLRAQLTIGSQQYLSILRLLKMGARFWTAFGPALLYIVWTREYAETLSADEWIDYERAV